MSKALAQLRAIPPNLRGRRKSVAAPMTGTQRGQLGRAEETLRTVIVIVVIRGNIAGSPTGLPASHQ
jgi:hypothetical protein